MEGMGYFCSGNFETSSNKRHFSQTFQQIVPTCSPVALNLRQNCKVIFGRILYLAFPFKCPWVKTNSSILLTTFSCSRSSWSIAAFAATIGLLVSAQKTTAMWVNKQWQHQSDSCRVVEMILKGFNVRVTSMCGKMLFSFSLFSLQKRSRNWCRVTKPKPSREWTSINKKLFYWCKTCSFQLAVFCFFRKVDTSHERCLYERQLYGQ